MMVNHGCCFGIAIRLTKRKKLAFYHVGFLGTYGTKFAINRLILPMCTHIIELSKENIEEIEKYCNCFGYSTLRIFDETGKQLY